MKEFLKIGFPIATADTLAQLCTYGGSLPQGAPTSPALSNLVFAEVDREISALSLDRRLTYSRYADDLTFSSLRPIPRLFVAEIDRLLVARGFALNTQKTIQPSGDVRALYGDTGATNIGLNPLTAKERIWYAGPDLAASTLLTGRTPEIIEAFKVVPRDVQDGMEDAFIGTRKIHPETDDFFRVVIEERKKLSKSHPHYLLLKIIANALYGIFAELNKNDYGKNDAKQLEVFSGEHNHVETAVVVERPGRFQFAPAAALITAGGRLMLAVLQRLIEDQHGTYLLTCSRTRTQCFSSRQRKAG